MLDQLLLEDPTQRYGFSGGEFFFLRRKQIVLTDLVEFFF